MRRSIAIALGSLTLFGLAAAARADEAADIRAGRGLYEQHSQLCHGRDGKGDGPLAAELQVTPPNLTEISKRRGESFPEVEIREIIDGRRVKRAHGTREMPLWGRVFDGPAVKGNEAKASSQSLDQLVVYLRSIQVTPAKTVGQR